MQGKLLQFLDSSEVRPVGANAFKKVDVRVLCASKSNLRDASAQGTFLEDLYYRLNDFPITIPPLRDRRGDIKLLVDFYLRRFAEEMKKQLPGLSRQAMQILHAYAWPGNVRELEKCIKRAVILADEHQPITVRHLPDDVKSPERRALESCLMQEGLTLREHVAQVEAQVIQACLRRAAGNKSEAARMLGISYPSLLQKIKLYGTTVEVIGR
jgi:transcriptional regulator with PAS, ATPase and Fis domain